MSRPARGAQEDFDTSDVVPAFEEDDTESDEDYSDELQRRDEDLFESLLDPLPNEDDETDEEE